MMKRILKKTDFSESPIARGLSGKKGDEGVDYHARWHDHYEIISAQYLISKSI